VTNEKNEVVGSIDMVRGIGMSALTDPQRSSTDLIFFDAVDPKPPTGQFPSERDIGYTLTPQFRSAPAQQEPPLSLTVHLPMATPPSQVPKIASAGIALSPYTYSPDYSSTDTRQRALWLEFVEPLANPKDAYFARVLNNAPDPVLTGDQILPPALAPSLPRPSRRCRSRPS
jgi:hypothetical protein